MENFYVVKKDLVADFLIEEEAYAGVKEIGKTVAEDLELVSGCHAKQRSELSQCTMDRVILFATLGKSSMLMKLEEQRKISLADIREKREVYQMQTVKCPFAENKRVKELLIIVGSDKRGTIYGMFHLSELFGVSPLVFFGDSIPEKNKEPMVRLAKPFISKEPSVKYRGFFINEESSRYKG